MHVHDDLDSARREMEEAILLPEGDPRRVAVAERARCSDALADLWSEVAEEHRMFGRRLNAVSVPEGLTDRLRAVRAQYPRRRRTRRLPRIATIAAVLGVVLGVVGWHFASSSGVHDGDPSVQALAMLAAMDHSSSPKLAVRTDDLAVLSSALARVSPFEVALLAPKPGAVLAGGRLCSFGDRPVIYTRWRTEGGDLALYQMEHRMFGLQPGLGPVDLVTPMDGSPDSRCRVRVWSDERFAYVVVASCRNPGG